MYIADVFSPHTQAAIAEETAASMKELGKLLNFNDYEVERIHCDNVCDSRSAVRSLVNEFG